MNRNEISKVLEQFAPYIQKSQYKLLVDILDDASVDMYSVDGTLTRAENFLGRDCSGYLEQRVPDLYEKFHNLVLDMDKVRSATHDILNSVVRAIAKSEMDKVTAEARINQLNDFPSSPTRVNKIE